MKTEDIALAHRVLADQARNLAILIACKFEHDLTHEVAAHWGHVGSAAKACEDLEALCEFLGVRA